MKKILKVLTVLSFLVIAVSAEANIFQEQRKEEYLQNTRVEGAFGVFGGEFVFGIKKALNDTLESEGLRARDYQLMGVTLYAKSRYGNGTATLKVGNDQSSRRIRKSPNGTWSGYAVDTMRVIEWDLSGQPGEASEGPWQLHLDGNLRIAHVEIHLRSKMTIVRMPLGDKMLGTVNQSESDRIRIKQMLNAKGIKPKDYNLRAVRVLAKSKGGNGMAKLFIGNSNMGNKNVEQAPQGNFQKNQPETYNRLNWMGLNESAQGNVWQVRFTGNNKAKRIVVVLKAIND